IPRSFGKTVIVFTSHLDLTWDPGVELKLGRPPSHRVWEAYQPHMTDAYRVDFTDCPRVADVREMADVVGRLGKCIVTNLSSSADMVGSQPAGFGTTRAALA
ncbi:hypothetical protein TNCV_1764501, partial [Trichonephila clavipes]